MKESGHYMLRIKPINSLRVDMENYNDQKTIQLLDLIFTHNLNYRF